MKRARPIAAAAPVILLSSFALPADGARFSIPLPATAQLCPDDGHACHSASLPAGADLGEFVNQHREAGRSYRLALQLPAGEFELRDTWLIDGASVPDGVHNISVSGSRPFTRLSGARDPASLRARVRTRDGITVIELPASLQTRDEAGWPTLRDSGGALRLTRWPREGWAEFTASASSLGNSIRAGVDAPVESWRDERAAQVQGFFRFGWHAASAPLARVDAGSRDLSMSGAIRYGVGDAGRYRVLNLRSEMREPGDYWRDSQGNFHFRPRDAGSAPSIRITVLATPLLKLSNVRSLDVTDIEFTATRGDGIALDHCVDVSLSQLRFDGIGRAGVVVDEGRNVRIQASTFEDLGEQAVILRGGDRAALEGSGHVIENCHIAHASQRLLTPASAIRLEGVGHVVRGNVIEDAPHMAIYFDGNDHIIESNWFERICLEVDDAGAIYAGRDWTARGTVIRNNVFTRIHAARKNGTAVGIYLDDMLSGIRIENNAMVDVDYGVLVGGGRDNVVEHNVFLRTKVSVHVDERARTWAHKAVAPGEVMEQRLNAMPTRSARWQAAYPALASMPRDDAPTPAGNHIRHNLAAVSGDPQFVASAAATGILEPPRAVELPVRVATANDLLAYCASGSACLPFDARVAAGSVEAAAR